MGKQIPWMNALFATAMVEKCSLATAKQIISCPEKDFQEAIKFRCTIACGGGDGKGAWFPDYDQSVYECFKKLESAN